ncbi:MAG: UDP-3-O-(3-hydroxymyristoyl)glucosamine N-acyltransferase [Cellvibrio sp.]|uniref:UDP-3-O-(3-hydroxymyristoyl)glucosamine N-acyltransferase n=1 Tax=Cellvibrio sp. TaxID=1965322 RepID=UPI0031AC6DEE
MKRSYLLSELAQLLDAELHGNSQQEIRALASIQSADITDLTFIANPAYKKHLSSTKAGAVLINATLADEFPGNKLIVKNPYLAYARLSALFEFRRDTPLGVHPTAVVGSESILGKNVSIGANAVVGEGVTLGDGVIIGPGCYVGNDSVIGERTQLAANVSIYHGITIGSDCLFHSGCVIGADGFGFAPNAGSWIKIHQLGSVQIGSRVEIGSCACIDRGALDDTVIDDGVIIDNLVQIAHNVRIGRNTAIAAHTAIAGSTTIGAGCTIAGAVGIAGHLVLADNVHITAMSLVSASISEPGSYSSGTAISPTKDWRKNAARFRQLDALATRLIKLERTYGAE